MSDTNADPPPKGEMPPAKYGITPRTLFPAFGAEAERYAVRWRAADHSARLAMVDELAAMTAAHAAAIALEVLLQLEPADADDFHHQVVGAWIVEDSNARGVPLP